jgi:hypothetical protein
MNLIQPITPTTTIEISIDRLSVCFNEPSLENVKATCGLLLDLLKTKEIPGMIITNSMSYGINARIPVPYMTPAEYTHPIFLQAGPHLLGLPSYRLDFNPSKMSATGIAETLMLLDSIMDPPPLEFFHKGKVTRVDVAIDLWGFTVDDLIVQNKRKQKHGVYSDRYGVPETVYLGTPKSSRLVVYTKIDPKTGELRTRIEPRLKPKCVGWEVASLPNPLSKMSLCLASVLDGLVPGVPGRLIADSIRVRGVKHVLDVFPTKIGKQIEKTLIASATPLPKPDFVWSLWPAALVNAGLGKELGVVLE